MNFNLCTSQGYKSLGNLNLTAFSLKLKETSYVYTRTKVVFYWIKLDYLYLEIFYKIKKKSDCIRIEDKINFYQVTARL